MRRWIVLLLLAFAAAAVAVPVATATDEWEGPSTLTACAHMTGLDSEYTTQDPWEIYILLWVIDEGGYYDHYLDEFVEVTAGPCAKAAGGEARLPDNVFVCGGGYNLDPGVLPLAQASAGLANGTYRNPYAVAGATPGRNNTQGTSGEQYTLTCDAGGRKATGTYVDNNGYRIPDAYEAAYKDMPAVYEVYA
jgi:hypothetical protein